MPAEFALDRLEDDRLSVVEPIAVKNMAEAEQFVLEAPEINEFGYGDTLPEALADLQAAIAELYFTLDADKERLGSDLQAVYTTLVRKLRRADAPHRP